MNPVRRLLEVESFRYVVVGGLTTGINVGAFYILTLAGIDYRVANTLAFVLSVLFAYFANEGFVFRSTVMEVRWRMKRGLQFLAMRLASYGVDMGLMLLLVGLLSFHSLPSKIGVNVVVILLNYVISKFHIFKEVQDGS